MALDPNRGSVKPADRVFAMSVWLEPSRSKLEKAGESCLEHKKIRIWGSVIARPARRHSIIKAWFDIFLCCIFCSGCSVNIADPKARSGWYLGLVRVERPPRSVGVEAVGLLSIGLGIDQGFVLGFRQIETVTVPAGTCSFTLIAKDAAGLDHAMTIVNQMDGQACIVDFSHPLP